MKVFVTGASGFIGTQLIKQLKLKNIDYLMLTHRKRIDTLGQQIMSNLDDIEGIKDKLLAFRPDVTVHLAWEGIPDYSYNTSKKNLEYGLNLLEICKYCGCKRVIITGSCWEYENPVGKTQEHAPISCANGFKASKNALRLMTEAFCAENEMDYNWLRLFYVYGPGQKETSLIPSIINSMRLGKEPELKAPFNKLDYIHVSDVASFIAHICQNKIKSGVINVGSGSMTESIEILRITGKKMDVPVDLRKYEGITHNIQRFCADTGKMEETGFCCKYTIEKGIDTML